MIDSLDKNPQKTFNELKNELKDFNADLLTKPIILIRSKSDLKLKINQDNWDRIPEYYGEISSVSRYGLNNLILKLSNILDEN